MPGSVWGSGRRNTLAVSLKVVFKSRLGGGGGSYQGVSALLDLWQVDCTETGLVLWNLEVRFKESCCLYLSSVKSLLSMAL